MSDANPHGRFVWYELMSTDPDAAVPFYESVIGWGTKPWEGGERPYTMWTTSEKPSGGVMQLPEEAAAAGAPPHWLAYIFVSDTDAAVARATELGATVLVPRTEIPSEGCFAVLCDPQGATFALFTPEREAPGPEIQPQAGEFSWNELITTDHEAAFDFYSALFGWQKAEAMDMGEMGLYQMYGRGGPPLGGMFNQPAEMPGPPRWLYYARVDDVHQAVERVREAGGQVLNGPMEVPGGDYVAQCMDPQGAAFALHSTAGDQQG
jgi:predicted enzyme related to lactoylglutathione lyase